MGTTTRPGLRVTLVAASLQREEELPGFEEVTDYASDSYSVAILSLKAAALAEEDLAESVEIELLDLPFTWDRRRLDDDVIEAVERTQPDVVGLSCYCWSLDALMELGARLSERRPETFVVAGGPSAGPVAPEVLATHRAVDAVVVGEGEATFVALLRALLAGRPVIDVPGLCARGPNGEPVRSSTPRAAVDLATLPSPYRMGVVDSTPRSLLLESSRGCRFHCRFCSWVCGPRKLRYFSLDSIEADLRWALDRGITSVKLVDTAVNFETERLEGLLGAVERADPHHALRFNYFLKAELLTAAQVGALRSLPSDDIIVGIESVDEAVRRRAGKPPLDLESFEDLLRRLGEVGPVTLSFILGLPGDSAERLARTLDWALALDARHPDAIHELCLFWLSLLPGSKLHAERVERRYRTMTEGTPYVLESQHHGPDEMLQMARVAASAHYARPKLRIETFHRDYLAQDAPIGGAAPAVPRRVHDERRTVWLVGETATALDFSGYPYPWDLGIEWMKAYAETDAGMRRAWRIELAHVPCRWGQPESGALRSLAELVEAHDPSLVVVSAGAGSAPALLAEASRRLAPGAPLIIAGAARTAVEAQRLLEATDVADGILFGEPERPLRELLKGGGSLADVPGLVARVGGALSSGPPCDPLADLDDIPSPFQWGLVERRDRMVVMRLSRPEPLRAHGPDRIFGDIRWAMEQRADHVLWLDHPFPDSIETIEAFVEAVRRADPEGRISHSFTLSGAAASSRALPVLLALPVRSIAVLEQKEKKISETALSAIEGLDGRPPQIRSLALDAGRVRALFRPWRDRGDLDGWAIVCIEPLGGAEDALSLSFVHAKGWEVEGRLLKRDMNRISVGLAPGPRPPASQDLRRLEGIVRRWLERGESFLLGG